MIKYPCQVDIPFPLFVIPLVEWKSELLWIIYFHCAVLSLSVVNVPKIVNNIVALL